MQLQQHFATDPMGPKSHEVPVRDRENSGTLSIATEPLFPVTRSPIDAIEEFLKTESAGGLCLMGATIIALVVANCPLGVYYAGLLNLHVEVRIGTFAIAKPLILWINDGLMAV